MFHPWIKAPKGKGKKTKRIEFLQSLYPNYKNDEVELLSNILDKDATKEFHMVHHPNIIKTYDKLYYIGLLEETSKL